MHPLQQDDFAVASLLRVGHSTWAHFTHNAQLDIMPIGPAAPAQQTPLRRPLEVRGVPPPSTLRSNAQIIHKSC